MLKEKRIISFIFTLFITIIIILPIIHADDNINQQKILTIWMPGITEDNYFTQIEVSDEQLKVFIDKIYATLSIINMTMLPDSTGISTITHEEWQKISVNVCDFIDSIKSITEDFPDVDTEKLISDIIESFFIPLPGFFRPKPFLSAGIGTTWIPFYDYETFLGLLLRPMLTKYQFGFTHIGGLLQCRITFGKYYMLNTCFFGLFVNLGDIGLEKIMGPTMYVGTVFVSRI